MKKSEYFLKKIKALFSSRKLQKLQKSRNGFKPKLNLNRHSIGFKINIAFIISVTAFGVILSSIVSPYIGKNMEQSIRQQSTMVAETQIKSIQTYVDTTVEELQLMSDSLKQKSDQEISNGYAKMRGSNKKFLDIYHIGQDGMEQMRQGYKSVVSDRKDDAVYSSVMENDLYISSVESRENYIGSRHYIETAVSVTDLLNRPIGIIGTYIDMNTLWNEVTSGIDQSTEQKMYIVSKDGSLVSTNDKSWLNEQVDAEGNFLNLLAHEGIKQMVSQIEETDFSETSILNGSGIFKNENNNEQVTSYTYDHNLGLAVFVETPTKVAFAAISDIQRIIYLIIFASIIAVTVFSIIFSRRLVSPINKLIVASNRISNGDLTTLTEIHRKDEIGALATSFDSMITNLRGIVTQTKNASSLTFNTSQRLKETAEDVAAASQEINAAIEQIAFGAENQVAISQSNDEKITTLLNIATKLDEQKSEVIQTAVFTQKTIASNQQILDSLINGVQNLASSTSDSANEVKVLEDRTNQIRNIVQTSREIADQTNLLALNASIEAARAGEHGKGFAVVADEVRKLAQASRAASNEVETIINNVVGSIAIVNEKMSSSIKQAKEESLSAEQAKQALLEIIKSMDSVLGSVELMDKLVSEQTEHVVEIQEKSKEALHVATDATSSTEEVAAASVQTSSNMNSVITHIESLLDMASDLQKSVERFKLED
ncbi:methyl-accepting chemotaxis protein [Bacillus luteolus]|uniref:Methyl-accepting chemotaxis protein n=1 Tax=Litchfieldia luteola TaxID=682179 RepID=A0ABR9QLK2_9BACI|nr:methyl-accepting chemotaxis protein [Cytobacillus luteolus]MBE4909373.1 methyl-accepting chemotaxis protein [Cytobacillus luteolus]MBP1940771.1 methyl-accepting chemotaxis protein [Cytobacillus luteolus]